LKAGSLDAEMDWRRYATLEWFKRRYATQPFFLLARFPALKGRATIGRRYATGAECHFPG
jgi:hypothetical protein